VVAFVTFFAGLKRVGPTAASTLSTFEPIVESGLASLVLDETITLTQVLGGLLILAVVLLARADKVIEKQLARKNASKLNSDLPAQSFSLEEDKTDVSQAQEKTGNKEEIFS
jgi:hypothetical protein